MIKNTSQKENSFNISKYSSNNEKILLNNSNNFTFKDANTHITKVNLDLLKSNELLSNHSNNVKECQKLISELNFISGESNENMLNNIKENFEKIYNDFTVQITGQRQENEKMQIAIDKLKREKVEIQQLVVNLTKLCGLTEQELGKYPY